MVCQSSQGRKRSRARQREPERLGNTIRTVTCVSRCGADCKADAGESCVTPHFCTAALFTWKPDAADVSRMAGHSDYRVTLDMYADTTAGVLDRARAATG